MYEESSVLNINNLTKSYGNTIAVKKLNLSVQKGSIHGFLGPNGSGKTTTLRCCVGLLKPDSGIVTLLGENIIGNIPKLMNKIGYIPGDVYLYSYYKVKQLLDYFQSLRGLKNCSYRKELVERLDINENIRIKALSKGNRQKIGIALALMHEPELLILDEPTIGLDPLLQTEFYKLMKEYKGQGKTIFFSSHNLSEVKYLCEIVSIIKEGSLVSTDNVSSLSKKLAKQITLEFSESCNKVLEIPNLTLEKMDGKFHHYHYSGEIKHLLSSLEKLPNLVDVKIPEVDIADYFMKFYKES